MPVISVKLVDRRNGCDIELVTEEILNPKRPGRLRKVGSYRISTSGEPRRVVCKKARSLIEAVRVADERQLDPKPRRRY